MHFHVFRRDLLRLFPAVAALPAAALAQGQVQDAPPPNPASFGFPKGFAFGASTSAYQIEGATHEDGRGPCIWDAFAAQKGTIHHGNTADITDDHYHLMPQDVALMAEAGLKHYRFSIAWTRLFPDGGTTPNPKGFAFYDRLFDELHKHGITPWPTLYHWDLPQALQEKGGWLNRYTSAHLADYAAAAARHFGDRVPTWLVMNEIAVQSCIGHGFGFHAPGLTGEANWLSALHHLNLGQGLAIQALRATAPHARVGTVAACEPIVASSASAADETAAAKFDAAWNGGVLEPLFKGTYPALIAEAMAPNVKTGDAANIAQPIDVLGLNYYNRLNIAHTPGKPFEAFFGPARHRSPYSAGGWPIDPDGLYDILTTINKTYKPREIVITENGFATADGDDIHKLAHDPQRISYIAQHLHFLRKAMQAGVPVGGYFVWSLLDNFEWNAGFEYRYGLVGVDFATRQRQPKDSLGWYAAVAKTV